jgi:hypothetical protein
MISIKKCHLKRLFCGVPLVCMPSRRMRALLCHSSSTSTNRNENELVVQFGILIVFRVLLKDEKGALVS